MRMHTYAPSTEDDSSSSSWEWELSDSRLIFLLPGRCTLLYLSSLGDTIHACMFHAHAGSGSNQTQFNFKLVTITTHLSWASDILELVYIYIAAAARRIPWQGSLAKPTWKIGEEENDDDLDDPDHSSLIPGRRIKLDVAVGAAGARGSCSRVTTNHKTTYPFVVFVIPSSL